MTENDISKVLLIRSVEECDPMVFSPEMLLDALRASGEAENDAALIRKRAHYLFEKLPDRLKNIPQTLHLPHMWSIIICIGVFVLGMGFNYLGPGENIHVIYNPVVLLILWNIGIFVIFLIRHFFVKDRDRDVHSLVMKTPFTSDQPRESEITPLKSVDPGYASSLSRYLFKKMWLSFHQKISGKQRHVKQFSSSAKITYRYRELWWDIYQHVIISRVTRYIHVLALCLLAGAMAGIYMRGLFFAYNVVWKSTFIHDPNVIAVILNVLFGLPSRLLHGTFIGGPDLTLLVSPQGEPAAPWIHMFAVSAFIFVVPGRCLLMVLESGRIKTLSRKITINPGEFYYARCITLAREMRADHLQEEVSTAVAEEVSRLSESVAVYARDRFFERQVVPQIVHFRNNGGSIKDLEEAIAQQSRAFTGELESFLETAQENFRKSLSEGISRIIGKKLLSLEINVEEGIRVNPDAYRETLDETVTSRMTGGISLAVTAAVAATVGTLSGGFGKVLGIAVISTLLHTTGPVGFIIGALAGLLLGGGASVLAKDKITDVVKKQRFPSFSTQLLLRESKMNRTVEEGRVQIYGLIKTEIENKLRPHINEMTREILSKIAIASK